MALINCPECGKEVSENAISCPNCGNPIKVQTQQREEYLCCPKCGSKELHSEHKGFSGGKALVGGVLTGGIGLLAGTIGSKDVLITCLKCGNKFSAGDAKIVVVGGMSDDELEQKAAEFLKEEKAFSAIELYKQERNNKATASEALEFIKKVREKYGIDAPKGGCMGLLILLLITSSLISIAAFQFWV